jgi:hypothetical protein
MSITGFNLMFNRTFNLQKLPCRTVYFDQQEDNELQQPWSEAEIRLNTLRFGNDHKDEETEQRSSLDWLQDNGKEYYKIDFEMKVTTPYTTDINPSIRRWDNHFNEVFYTK